MTPSGTHAVGLLIEFQDGLLGWRTLHVAGELECDRQAEKVKTADVNVTRRGEPTGRSYPALTVGIEKPISRVTVVVCRQEDRPPVET